MLCEARTAFARLAQGASLACDVTPACEPHARLSRPPVQPFILHSARTQTSSLQNLKTLTIILEVAKEALEVIAREVQKVRATVTQPMRCSTLGYSKLSTRVRSDPKLAAAWLRLCVVLRYSMQPTKIVAAATSCWLRLHWFYLHESRLHRRKLLHRHLLHATPTGRQAVLGSRELSSVRHHGLHPVRCRLVDTTAMQSHLRRAT